MSTSALSVVIEAAGEVGDPQFSRVTRDDWTVILNQSARDMARKLMLTLHTATFDIVAGDEEYKHPDDCIQIKSIRWSDNPTDKGSWVWMDEKFEDEYRSLTQRAAPTGSPYCYFTLVDTFFLYHIPDRDVPAGGKIQYWGLPDAVGNISTQGIPLLDVMRDTLRDRMVIYGFRRLEKWDAAREREKEWQATLTVDRDRITDRSADRRTRLRPSSRFSSGQR